MTPHIADVTIRLRDRSRLPDWTVEFAAIVHHLQQTGMLQQLAERLRLARAGYAGLDLALVSTGVFLLGQVFQPVDVRRRVGWMGAAARGLGRPLALAVGVERVARPRCGGPL